MKKRLLGLELLLIAFLPVVGGVVIDGNETALDSLSPALQKRVSTLRHGFGDSLEITLVKDDSRIFEIGNFNAKTDKKYAKIIVELEKLVVNDSDSLSVVRGLKLWQSFGNKIAHEAGYPGKGRFTLVPDRKYLQKKCQIGANSTNPFKFDELYNGIEVDESYLYGILKADRLSSIWFKTYANISPEIRGMAPALSFDEALKKYLNGRTLPAALPKPTGKLCYCSLKNTKSGILELCWRTEVDGSIVYLSAVTGEIVWQHRKYS
jgi:hypothetical protein